MDTLIDPFGRAVSYLRISVTDRCNYRCTYCMSENMSFLPKNDLLSLEELDRVCTAFVNRGVNKLRITGGEPLVRKDVLHLFERLGRHISSGMLEELTLTTNGSLLAKYAHQLFAFGVRRINVSLDTLDEAKFKSVTRWGSLQDVLDGLEDWRVCGLDVLLTSKINRGTCPLVLSMLMNEN